GLSYLVRAGFLWKFPTLSILITTDWIFRAGLIALAGAMLGASYPAWMASRKDAVEALFSFSLNRKTGPPLRLSGMDGKPERRSGGPVLRLREKENLGHAENAGPHGSPRRPRTPKKGPPNKRHG